ncbi:MAG: hypothetical protein A3J67_06550 [Parcubacteria group bacterium RIFCSPHIGHO2_02_FULL_48_10b]|nr:MAG: hypothetical protein A3J67_06550 [Parcubacteria group bacterium RIFCSPHIGHO2_02_FULL_48_10b]
MCTRCGQHKTVFGCDAAPCSVSRNALNFYFILANLNSNVNDVPAEKEETATDAWFLEEKPDARRSSGFSAQTPQEKRRACAVRTSVTHISVRRVGGIGPRHTYVEEKITTAAF